MLKNVLFACTWLLSVAFAFAQSNEGGEPEVRTELKVESKAIPFEVEYQFSREVGAGRLVKVRDGRPGEVRKIYKITFAGTNPAKKELIRTERVEPISTLYHMGKAGFTTSRGSFTRSKVMVLEATAYDKFAGRGKYATGITKTGRKAEFGIVAVDPRVIPLNTLLYVEGYGFAIAADTGGAIKGKRIDLCMDSSKVWAFGRRKVKVHIFSNR